MGLINKVNKMLARSDEYKEIEKTIDSQEGLYGKLIDLSLIEVIELLGMNKKTGDLVVNRNDKKATIYFPKVKSTMPLIRITLVKRRFTV